MVSNISFETKLFSKFCKLKLTFKKKKHMIATCKINFNKTFKVAKK